APPGSGLGSSGALDVALVSALIAARGETMDRAAIAHAAWRVEVEDAGVAGGKQDQYAAALGGFLRLEFQGTAVRTASLALDPQFVRHLERHLVICYTGSSRVSANMITRVMNGYERGDPVIVEALRGMKDVASSMITALHRSDVAAVGALLSRNWHYQRQLDPGMCTDMMARLEKAVESAGVLGGKAAGAGAGGCMFFLANSSPRAVGQAAVAAGARLLPATLVGVGVRSW
ncbi:MAG: hypothetical protein ABI679_07085, partial [Gemmatimonadota bacterium]